MATANTFKSDLYAIGNYVQNSMITHPKEVFIDVLRDFFSQDTYYRYVADPWGFPKVPDHTDLGTEAGIENDLTTRIFIGEYYRFDSIYYPAILVKSGGSRYTPLSMSQNRGSVIYGNTLFIDGYGNETTVATPEYFQQDGAWEGTINLEIKTLDGDARNELTGLVSILFGNYRRQELQNAGVFVKGVSASGESETDDGNHKLFNVTISVDIRTEWRRRVPVSDTIDAINICVDFGDLQTEPPVLAPNLRIATQVELLTSMLEL